MTRDELLDQAACNGMPTEWWFPKRGPLKPGNVKAKAICNGGVVFENGTRMEFDVCPVRVECGLQREAFGIWGGESAGSAARKTKSPRVVAARLCVDCGRVLPLSKFTQRDRYRYGGRWCNDCAQLEATG